MSKSLRMKKMFSKVLFSLIIVFIYITVIDRIQGFENLEEVMPEFFEKKANTVKIVDVGGASDTNMEQIPELILLDVPLLNQMDAPRLYNGCEVTSLAMILNYNGFKVTKNELADKVRKVPLNYDSGLKGNPNEGFVGNIEDGPGLSVYHGPILNLAKYYVGERAVDLTGESFDNLLKKIDKGLPVWIITTTKFAPVSNFEHWNTPKGPIEITFSVHSVVITGYDSKNIYINDPYGYKNRKVERNKFIKAWEQMGKQALIIENSKLN